MANVKISQISGGEKAAPQSTDLIEIENAAGASFWASLGNVFSALGGTGQWIPQAESTNVTDPDALALVDMTATGGNRTVTLPEISTISAPYQVAVRVAAVSGGNHVSLQNHASDASGAVIWRMYEVGQIVHVALIGGAWIRLFPASGQLVRPVRRVIKTDTQVSADVAAGAGVAVSGLTLSNALANTANIVELQAVLTGQAGGNRESLGGAITAGGTAIDIGDAAGNRRRLSAAGSTGGSTGTERPVTLALHARHLPASLDAVTYGVNAHNLNSDTQSVNINRSSSDGDLAYIPRTVSYLLLWEIAS